MGPRDGGVVGEGAEEPERSERAFVAGVVGMRRSEEAKVSEEAVRRKGGGGGPRELGMSRRWGGRVARVKCGKSAAGREGTRRSEKAKVPEDGGLINQTLIGLKTYERLCTY